MTDLTLKDKSLWLCALYLTFFIFVQSPGSGRRSTPRLIPVAKGWAKNQINAVIFRRNSIVSYGNTQYVAFYNEISNVTLAKRRLGSLTWEITLGGLGTRRIPISRPQVLVVAIDRKIKVLLIFRAAERGNRISLATTDNLQNNRWVISDLTKTPVGMWEPTFDPVMWVQKRELHLLVQNVDQVDDEGVQNISAQMISVLEWKP